MNPWLLTLACVGLSACGSNELLLPASATPVDAAETAVAEAVMRSWWGTRPGGAARIRGQVVDDRLDPFCAGPFLSSEETRTRSELQADALRRAAGDDAELLQAVEDFLAKRTEDFPTHFLVDGIDGVDLQSVEEISMIEDGDSFWARFGKRFPRSQGYGRLSRVGLSRDGKLAVLAHSILAGPLMGYGRYAVFEKVDGKWIASSRKIKGGWMS